MILNDRQTIGDRYCEWFTWLAERIGEYENKENSPKAAHIEYAKLARVPELNEQYKVRHKVTIVLAIQRIR